MKRKLLSTLMLILLTSCNSSNVTTVKYSDELKNDVNALINGVKINPSDKENKKYILETKVNKTKDETAYVYNFYIKYLATVIENIKVVIVPELYKDDSLNHNLPYIGYDSPITLSSYKGILLEYETSSSSGTYFMSISYNGVVDRYTLSPSYGE